MAGLVGEEHPDGDADRLLLAVERQGAHGVGLRLAAGDEDALAGSLEAGEGEDGLGEAVDLEELIAQVLVAEGEAGGEAGEGDVDLPGALGPGGLVEAELAGESGAAALDGIEGGLDAEAGAPGALLEGPGSGLGGGERGQEEEGEEERRLRGHRTSTRTRVRVSRSTSVGLRSAAGRVPRRAMAAQAAPPTPRGP